MNMNKQKVTFKGTLDEFEESLDHFENEVSPQVRGVSLSNLFHLQELLDEFIKNEISTIDQRRMREALANKIKRFKQLEADFLNEARLLQIENQLQDFITLAKPMYNKENNTEEEINNCMRKYYLARDNFLSVKNLDINGQKLKQQQEKMLKNLNDAIIKFQQKFSRNILAHEKREKDKKNTKQDSKYSSQSLEEEYVEEITNTPTVLLQIEKVSKERQQNLKGSIIEDLRLSNENKEEDYKQLQSMKQQLQSDLEQKKREQLLREEEEQKEYQEEINLICNDIYVINAMMNDMSQMIQGQGENLEIIETQTEQTLQNVVATEKELTEASDIQVSYRKKLFALKGGVLGGGVGFFMGGPLGSAIGGVVGATVGKVFGSTSSKKTL